VAREVPKQVAGAIAGEGGGSQPARSAQSGIARNSWSIRHADKGGGGRRGRCKASGK